MCKIGTLPMYIGIERLHPQCKILSTGIATHITSMITLIKSENLIEMIKYFMDIVTCVTSMDTRLRSRNQEKGQSNNLKETLVLVRKKIITLVCSTKENK